MTPKNTADPEGDDDSLGVLDDTASSDTGIGLLGGTAHVNVALPTGDEDDDLVDDEVVGGEIVSDLVIDTSAVADADTVARIQQESPEIIIELPAEAPQPREEGESGAAEQSATELVDTEIVDPDPAEAPPVEPQPFEAPPVEPRPFEAQPFETQPFESEVEEAEEIDVIDHIEHGEVASEAAAYGDEHPDAPSDADAATPDAPTADAPTADAPTAEPAGTAEAAVDSSALSHLESVVAAAKAELREAMSPAPTSRRSTGKADVEPAEKSQPVVNEDRSHAEQHPRAEQRRSAAEAALSSKRFDELEDSGRESADLLTPDRLLDPSRIVKPEPEGAWSHFLYTISGGRINIGDGRKARARKELSARIAAPMPGTASFVPVLSRKGGVGKTTVTALLGMALADARDDRVIAVDANPDRGTLAERVVGSHSKSVRDMVRAQHDIRGFHDISAIVARDETRLDVLASDMDPRVSEAFGDRDYRDVATVAAQYYSLVLTDSGTGIVHSVMGATLDLADQIVIVSGLSVDEARLASETLTWLETNGHAELARNAVVVLNQSTPGAPLVRLSELEAHFATRAEHVLRIPYDPQIAGGGPIDFSGLQSETRRAARQIAAVLVESLRSRAGR